MNLQEVREFFSIYNAAFDALNGEAVAALWHSPSGIRAGEDMTWWSEHAPMRRNTVALCALYRQAGYVRATHRITDHVAMGQDAAFVNVAWTIEGEGGGVLQSFSTGYNLQRFAGEAAPSIRVVLCTAYEEDLNEIKSNAAH
ncbi:MAG: hypothetical protein RL341_1473 [Pseudomonadota bacterium]|jgi:hypothetical protein